MSNTILKYVDRSTTVRFVDQNTTLKFVDRNTTINVVDRSTILRFVDRNTTVRFPVASVSSTQFTALEANYTATLPEYVSNEAAKAVLSAGAEYKAAAGHYAAPQGTRLIVI